MARAPRGRSARADTSSCRSVRGGTTPGRRLGQNSVRRLAPLAGHLVSLGVLPGWEAVPDVSPADQLLGRYSRYLLEERGLPQANLRHYVGVARSFLASLPSEAQLDLQGLSAVHVKAFVLAESRRCKTGSAKSMTTRLRALLRFLYVEGLVAKPSRARSPAWRTGSWLRCPRRSGRSKWHVCSGVATAGGRWPPGLRHHHHAVAPRASCRRSRPPLPRRRRRAAGEVAIKGKGRREDRLPLPADVGEAVVAWLQQGRPRSGCREVFLRMRAPKARFRQVVSRRSSGTPAIGRA